MNMLFGKLQHHQHFIQMELKLHIVHAETLVEQKSYQNKQALKMILKQIIMLELGHMVQ